MAPDDDDIEDDLYDDEFDFVDDEDSELEDESDLESGADGSDSGDADSDVDSDVDSEVEEKKPAPREAAVKRPAARQQRFVDDDASDEPRDRNPRDRDTKSRNSDRDAEPAAEMKPVEEEREPEPPANYRVHVYEHREFTRTIDRPFTAEDAEAFASEYNRTSKSYSRFAIAGKEDVKPKKLLD